MNHHMFKEAMRLGRCADTGWSPHPECGLDVKTDDTTYTPRGCEVYYHSLGFSAESRVASQAGQKMTCRKGKEDCLGVGLWWLGGRSRVRGPAHGVNFLPAPKEEHPGFLISFPRYGGLGERK